VELKANRIDIKEKEHSINVDIDYSLEINNQHISTVPLRWIYKQKTRRLWNLSSACVLIFLIIDIFP
jgi:hypothetical protein